MAIKIKGKPYGELDLKRCFLPGVEFKVICPNCGYKDKDFRDWEGDTFNYPVMNEPMDHRMYCGKCNHEWDERIIFRVHLDPVRTLYGNILNEF